MFLEFFYLITIYPLELIMKCVLHIVYTSTGSGGKALIAVSVVVSIGVLPLYHVAKKWQDAERRVQRKMKAKIDEFKSVLSGYELHACLHTLYRQHNYRPIYAIRTSFGILIQIPFFLAAYHLLSHYEAFNHMPSLFVKDLGKPAGLIHTPWGTLNLLPFVMTGVNLLSTFIYGKKTTSKEKLNLFDEYLNITQKNKVELSIKNIKETAINFSTGIIGGKHLREAIVASKEKEEVVRLVNDFKKNIKDIS